MGAVARRAHLAGGYFILEKDGIPVAGIMSADEMEDYWNSKIQRLESSGRAHGQEVSHQATAPMTPPGFVVHVTPHYERLSNKLFKSHPDFEAAEQEAKEILAADPYNQSRRHQIKKPEGVRSGEKGS